jgi:hypothetical protein
VAWCFANTCIKGMQKRRQGAWKEMVLLSSNAEELKETKKVTIIQLDFPFCLYVF